MYGEGVTGDRAKVMAAVTAFRDDSAMLVRRSGAALTALRNRPAVGAAAAVVGFCFGGMAALALAQAGADIAAPALHGFTHRHAVPGAVPGSPTFRHVVHRRGRP